MKKDSHSNSMIMETLGINSNFQIKEWANWYCTGQTVGKQYSYGK